MLKSATKTILGFTVMMNFAILKNKKGPQSEKVKKNFQKIFKGYGLDVIVQ